jgi:protein-S-isoprenylcysteine O-methyltransferase Ste14
MLGRIGVFLYGLISYLLFFGTFLYALGWVGNLVVPKSIDSAPTMPFGQALLIDLLLLGVFAIQHSVMARKGFKDFWTKLVPQVAERSTYVLASSLAMIVMFYYWQPLGGVVWQVEQPVAKMILMGMFGFGWLLVLVTTFLINHFDLFGLRQVWLHLLGKDYTPLAFTTPGPYRLVRHPLYVGWLFAFWSAPVMTVTHLVFAVTTTAYILIAIQLEERDLLRDHAEYHDYRRRVPMLIPGRSRHAHHPHHAHHAHHS